MSTQTGPYAVVTGASTGIGFELARCCAQDGFDLLIAADEPAIGEAASRISAEGGSVEALQVDLATPEGVAELHGATRGRPVSALLANAGIGLGGGFLDQDWQRVRRLIDLNVVGTLDLIQRIGRDMRRRGEGRILITGSIAGLMPGTYHAVFNGTKALLDSFAYALGAELDGTGVTVTCLMPGVTETEFFERADLTDTKYGTQKKQSPEEVARTGFAAMMKGEAEVVTGWNNKLRAAISHLIPNTVLAKMHAKEAGPGTGTGR